MMECIGAGSEQMEFPHVYLVTKEMSFIPEVFSEIFIVWEIPNLGIIAFNFSPKLSKVLDGPLPPILICMLVHLYIWVLTSYGLL